MEFSLIVHKCLESSGKFIHKQFIVIIEVMEISISPVSTSPVLVTGGRGFIASHIISVLLSKGYRVRTTVRSLEDESSYRHLRELDKTSSPSRLEIVEADLLSPASWDKVFEGVEYVIHTASPFILKPADPENTLFRPTVEGTRVSHLPLMTYL